MIPPPAPADRFAAELARLGAAGRLALAVSGGPDSVAMLLLAAAARPGAVIAATVDHGLRPAAADEARFVAGLCADRSIPHATLAVRIADDGTGVQAAARTARYAALETWAAEAGATALATAHHLDDQAETVLMRLARGSGIAGLTGIRPTRALPGGLPLVRPLLRWRRAELAAIVAAAGIRAVDDPSNRDSRFDRTRARALLAANWPDAERIAAVADHLAEASEALDWATAMLFADRVAIAEDGSATLDVAALPADLRRRLLLLTLEKSFGINGLRGDEITRLLDRLAGGTVSTLAGYRFDPGPPWRIRRAPAHRSV